MIDFIKTNSNKIEFTVDTELYSDIVITKSLYWLSSNYFVYQSSNGKIQEICIEKKHDDISLEEIISLKQQINQNLIDFKVREIVAKETKNIRDILYVKAFSNNDDFEDHNLKAD